MSCPQQDPDSRDERAPSPEEWAGFERALAQSRGEGDATCDRDEREMGAFLSAIGSLDGGLRERFERTRISFRFRLRGELHRSGIVPGAAPRSRFQRGLGLALQYARLRMRESIALRAAAILLFLHLLALPVTAAILHYRTTSQETVHGEWPIRFVREEPAAGIAHREVLEDLAPTDEIVEPGPFEQRR